MRIANRPGTIACVVVFSEEFEGGFMKALRHLQDGGLYLITLLNLFDPSEQVCALWHVLQIIHPL